MASNGLTYEHGAKYLGRPVRWGLCESKEKKTPQFYLSFEILGQIDPQNPDGQLFEAPQGERTVFWALTPAAIDNLIRDLADLGYDRPDLSGLDQNGEHPFDFGAREIVVNCKHEQYNGKWKERFDYGQGGSFTPVPMDQKDVMKLNAMFGNKFAKLGRPTAPRVAPTRPAQPQTERPTGPSRDAGAAPAGRTQGQPSRPVPSQAVPSQTSPSTADIPF